LVISTHVGIGIDESTAIIVRNKLKLIGESEVIVVQKPKGITKVPKNNTIGIKSLEMSIHYEGQKFKIK
jgi:cyanophycinase